MNLTQTTPGTYDATKGQTICRASEWQDVAKFFLLNYGLHVFTVFLPPGTSGPSAVRESLMSLVVPVYGITRSCRAIFTCARRARNQLDTALMSGALCMVVPADGSPTRVRCSTRRAWRVWIELRADAASRVDPKTTIHGQFPAGVWAPTGDAESGVTTPRWCLRIVPKSFTVVAPIGPPAVPLQLSCNYKFLTASAGIVQVLSGSMAIYHASERQIPYFGYAAYSLTVVPYVIMSLVNLVGSMCQPQYPAMFLVRYCGPIPPAVISTDGDQVYLLPQRNDRVEQSSEVQSWTEPELGGIVGSAYGDLFAIPEEDTTLFKVGLFRLDRAVAKIDRFATTLFTFWSGQRRIL